MPAILGSKPVTVAVMTTLIAGDFLRHALTVPVWAALGVLCALWGVTVLVGHRSALRTLPLPLTILWGWWAVTPFWSPYAPSAWLMILVAAMFISTGFALVVTMTGDEFVRRLGFALRWVLIGSLAFEIIVALIGSPVYPVGFSPTANTPIEMAWSRAELFQLDGRIQGLVGNANILGMLALLSLLIAAVGLISTRSWRTIAGVDVVLSTIVLARTMSATVTLALIGVGAVTVLLWWGRRRSLHPGVTLAAGAGLVVVAGVAAALRWDSVTALLGKSSDLTHRVDIWSAVLARIGEAPVVGHGFVGWWPSWDPWFAISSVDGLAMSQAHNVWLDLTMQTGLIGVTLFAVVLGIIGWRLWNVAHSTPTSIGTLALLSLVALTIQSLAESRFLHEWGLVAIALCGLAAFRVEARTSERR